MSKFTDRLWREIVREHGADLRETEPLAARRRQRALPRVLAGTGLVGVAGAGVTLAIVLGAASTTPAFAVTRNHDGTYSVAIQKFSAIPSANARLNQLGLRAQFVQVTNGCPPPQMKALLAARAHAQVSWVATPGTAPVAGSVAKIAPDQIPAGRTLVLGAVRMGEVVRVAKAQAVAGKVPECLPPPPCFMTGPAARGGGGSTTGTSTSGTTGTGTGTSTTSTGTTSTGTTSTGTTSTGTTSTGTTPTGTGATPPPPVKITPAQMKALQIARQKALAAARGLAAPAPPGTATTGTSTATTTTGTTTTGTTTSGTSTGTTTTGTSTTRTSAGSVAGVITPVPGTLATGATGVRTIHLIASCPGVASNFVAPRHR
jgi:hypothetical protein